MQTFYTVMTSYGARMGTAVIAAHAIARQCASLEALIVDGLAVATQALVAMYLGQGQKETARRLCSRLLFLGGVAGSLLGMLLYACSGPIARYNSTLDDDGGGGGGGAGGSKACLIIMVQAAEGAPSDALACCLQGLLERCLGHLRGHPCVAARRCRPAACSPGLHLRWNIFGYVP